ncbi:glycosyltransferase family 2 protein [Glycomyces sp. NPDC048151]|uniref:glycosyltransferase family 2 protein n=1 Tax=Glycomyces sp. NPDC048151 TaxID=3364002 RepID=UPI003710D25A
MSTELPWSVVVPCHNAAKTIERCLAAVFAQTSPPAEVIVVDDASTDATAAIADRFPCRTITLDPNRGPAAARNLGAAKAKGDVLFFLDADIELRPDALARAAAALAAPRVGLVQGVYAAEPMIDDGPVERYKTLFEHRWRTDAAGPTSVTLFALTAIRAEVFTAAGGFDESLRSGEDVEFGSRLPARWAAVTDPGVVGRHDDVDRLGPLLAEQWRRSLRFAELFARARRAPSASDTVRTGAYGPYAVLAVAAVCASAPLALWSPWLALLPVLFAAAFALASAPLLTAAAAHGRRWAAAVFALHLLYVGTAGLASLVGVLRPAVWRGRS